MSGNPASDTSEAMYSLSMDSLGSFHSLVVNAMSMNADLVDTDFHLNHTQLRVLLEHAMNKPLRDRYLTCGTARALPTGSFFDWFLAVVKLDKDLVSELTHGSRVTAPVNMAKDLSTAASRLKSSPLAPHCTKIGSNLCVPVSSASNSPTAKSNANLACPVAELCA